MGTRAGSIGIYCANEAIADSGIEWDQIDRERVGVYVGVTEHGNVETENEVYEISGYDYDTSVWSHHHNPRTVANNPAGEITLNMGITGPHYTIGAACAGRQRRHDPRRTNVAARRVRLGDLRRRVGKHSHVCIFAGFASQGGFGGQ